MDNPLFVLTITRSWNNDTDVGVSVRESPDDNISITRVFCDGIIALDGDFFAVPAKEALLIGDSPVINVGIRLI